MKGEQYETYLTYELELGEWAYGIYVNGEPARGGFQPIKADALRHLRSLAREFGAGRVDNNGYLRVQDYAS